jgi:predicted transcriptional regulator
LSGNWRLKTKKLRNLYLYSSAVTRTQAQKSEVMRTLKRAFDGTFTPMMQFLIENEQLSDDEYDAMAKMIKNRKRGKATKKK